ncbi:MAG: MTH1187 family thiamine-binding protein [Bacillota bacterium]|nr:MTH1187 family thiamine-binding protein [Bacillota bacterium]MDW7683932.1 MTH1187 family thiamine-binding protein [Bacillota bacterium]
MPILEISIMPIGTDEASFSSYIDKACHVVENHGLQYRVTPMATMVEGEMEKLMDVVRDVHSLPFASGVERVITNVTIDERRDKVMDMEQMVNSVNNH